MQAFGAISRDCGARENLSNAAAKPSSILLSTPPESRVVDPLVLLHFLRQSPWPGRLLKSKNIPTSRGLPNSNLRNIQGVIWKFGPTHGWKQPSTRCDDQWNQIMR